MKKLFWENPYQIHLHTQVKSVNGNEVLFESTIAYSFAGGQESDKTTVNGIPILDSRREGNLIYYTLPEGHGLKVGDQVFMEIDWPRRSRLVRLHFAAELILEVVSQRWGLEKVGAHIAEHKSRIDFKFDQNISTYFPEILAEYNRIIEADYPIQKEYSDVQNQRRFWSIEG